jgi:hypothetical protein
MVDTARKHPGQSQEQAVAALPVPPGAEPRANIKRVSVSPVARVSAATVGNQASRPSLVGGNACPSKLLAVRQHPATPAHTRMPYAAGQAHMLPTDPRTRVLAGPASPGAKGSSLPASGQRSRLRGPARPEKLPPCVPDGHRASR